MLPAACPARRPTLSGRRSGITLIEMLIVMAIVSVMLAVAYPGFTAGIDGVRLRTSVDRAGQFWSAARQRADRFQTVVQVSVDPKKSELRAAAADSDWRESFAIADGLSISSRARTWLLYPGTPSPAFELLLASPDGSTDGLRVNVFTGVPERWKGAGDDEGGAK